jgi:hypothetical protein
VSVPPFESASRRVPKATYAPLALPVDPTAPGGVRSKRSYVASLNLQTGEVVAVAAPAATSAGARRATAASSALTTLLEPFEGSPLPSSLLSASSFAAVQSLDLRSFGERLKSVRRQDVTRLVAADSDAGLISIAQAQLNWRHRLG